MAAVPKIQLVLLIAIVLLTSRANGLKCYFCSSSSSIYNEDCEKGVSTIRSGQCPSGYEFCIARHTIHADGSSAILRDCSASNGSPPLNTDLSIAQISCRFDLCNKGLIGSATPTTLPSTSPDNNDQTSIATTTSLPSTFNPSNAAPRLHHAISLCTWTFGLTLYFLAGVVLLMDAFSNVF